jgi:hypothetical protein
MFDQRDVNEFLTNIAYGAFAAAMVLGLLCIAYAIVTAIRRAVRRSHHQRRKHA